MTYYALIIEKSTHEVMQKVGRLSVKQFSNIFKVRSILSTAYNVSYIQMQYMYTVLQKLDKCYIHSIQCEKIHTHTHTVVL